MCAKSRAVDGRTSAFRTVCIKCRALVFSRTVCEATQSAGMMSLYPPHIGIIRRKQHTDVAGYPRQNQGVDAQRL